LQKLAIDEQALTTPATLTIPEVRMEEPRADEQEQIVEQRPQRQQRSERQQRQPRPSIPQRPVQNYRRSSSDQEWERYERPEYESYPERRRYERPRYESYPAAGVTGRPKEKASTSGARPAWQPEEFFKPARPYSNRSDDSRRGAERQSGFDGTPVKRKAHSFEAAVSQQSTARKKFRATAVGVGQPARRVSTTRSRSANQPRFSERGSERGSKKAGWR